MIFKSWVCFLLTPLKDGDRNQMTFFCIVFLIFVMNLKHVLLQYFSVKLTW